MKAMSVQEFQKEYYKILEQTPKDEIKNTLSIWLEIHHASLPKFYSHHLVRDFIYLPKKSQPLWCTDIENTKIYNDIYYSNITKLKAPLEIAILPEQAVGATWIFENKWSEGWKISEGKPEPHRLSRLLLDEKTAPPSIYVTKLGQYYYFGDGNHRLYAAYLLGKTVEIECTHEYHDIYDKNGNKLS